MKLTPIIKDERTISVENASYRWGYMVVSFGLLLIVIYRSLIFQDSSWDLMGLVILGSLVTMMYQAFHRILSRRLVVWAALMAVLAAVVAVIVTFLAR